MSTSEVAVTALQIISPVIISLLGLLAARLNQWLKSKLNSELAAQAAFALEQAVIDCVKASEQTLVKELKATKGDLTREDKERIKEETIKSVKEHMGADTVKRLQQLFGSDALEAKIVSKLEAAVHSLGE
jgi:DNA-binding transcriptional regulator YdaS (Cro superfamily)